MAENEDKGIDMVERCKYALDQVNTWISNAESKVSISCGIFTGVFGVITFLADKIKEPATNAVAHECFQCVYKASFVLSLITMGISILFYVLAINPSIKSNGITVENKVPIFYGDINKLCNCQYKKAVFGADDKAFCDELLNEVHFNAAICTRKMRMYKIGLWLSFAAVGMAVLSWAMRFFMYG